MSKANKKQLVVYTTQACGHDARHVVTLSGYEAQRVMRAMNGVARNNDALKDHGVDDDHTYDWGTRAELLRRAATASQTSDSYQWSVARVLRRECEFL